MRLSLQCQTYNEDTNTFIFWMKEKRSGKMVPNSALNLMSDKAAFLSVPPKHRVRIAYIAGFEWAQQNEAQIAEFKLAKQNENKFDDKDKKQTPIKCNKNIQVPKVS